MQLSGDNSTISVKVNIYMFMTIFMPHINHYPIGCPWEASFRGLHDNIHADNPDEHCGALHHVFQAVLL